MGVVDAGVDDVGDGAFAGVGVLVGVGTGGGKLRAGGDAGEAPGGVGLGDGGAVLEDLDGFDVSYFGEGFEFGFGSFVEGGGVPPDFGEVELGVDGDVDGGGGVVSEIVEEGDVGGFDGRGGVGAKGDDPLAGDDLGSVGG